MPGECAILAAALLDVNVLEIMTIEAIQMIHVMHC